jgi:hypothetical protein
LPGYGKVKAAKYAASHFFYWFCVGERRRLIDAIRRRPIATAPIRSQSPAKRFGYVLRQSWASFQKKMFEDAMVLRFAQEQN